MVRVNSTYSIDHELKAKYAETVGFRRVSDDLEDYMRSVVKDREIKNTVAPDQGTTITNTNSGLSILNLEPNLKNVVVQEPIIDILNMSKGEVSTAINKLNDKRSLGKIGGMGTFVNAISKTRIQKLNNSGR